MSFQSHTSETRSSDAQVIDEILRNKKSTGSSKSKAKAKVKASVLTSAIQNQPVSDARLLKKFQAECRNKIQDLDETGRIVAILLWLSQGHVFPKMTIKTTLLHLMVFGGTKQKKSGCAEMKTFGRKFYKAKRQMIAEYGRTILPVKNGRIRATVDAEDYAVNVMPKRVKSAHRVHTELQNDIAKCVGDSTKIRVTSEENRPLVEQAQRQIPILERMASSVKALLPQTAT